MNNFAKGSFNCGRMKSSDGASSTRMGYCRLSQKCLIEVEKKYIEAVLGVIILWQFAARRISKIISGGVVIDIGRG